MTSTPVDPAVTLGRIRRPVGVAPGIKTTRQQNTTAPYKKVWCYSNQLQSTGASPWFKLAQSCPVTSALRNLSWASVWAEARAATAQTTPMQVSSRNACITEAPHITPFPTSLPRPCLDKAVADIPHGTPRAAPAAQPGVHTSPM